MTKVAVQLDKRQSKTVGCCQGGKGFFFSNFFSLSSHHRSCELGRIKYVPGGVPVSSPSASTRLTFLNTTPGSATAAALLELELTANGRYC